jgi:hypothetical protein
MSSDEEMGYGSIETPKVESTTSRRRGVTVFAALALFGLVAWVRSGRSGVVLKGKLENEQADKPSPRSVALTRKTVTALIRIFGQEHKHYRCEPENGYHGGCCEPENGHYRGCEGHTAPPTDAPTSKPTASPTDAPGFFGRLFGGGSSASALGGSSQGMRTAFWGGEGGDDHAWDPDNWNDDDEWRMSVAASGRRLFIVIDRVDKIKEGPTNGTSS